MNKFQKIASKIAAKESEIKYDGKYYNEFKMSYLIGFRRANYTIKEALDFKNKYIKHLKCKYMEK